jgi:ribonuclease BN (tRNA processing enzyme)
LIYTGDAGPSASIVDLARGCDLMLAEATFVEHATENPTGRLSSARQAGG